MHDSAPAASPRITRLLLALTSLFFVLTVALGAILLTRHRNLAELEARLLAEEALQTELLASQPSDQAVYPHAVPAIGFTLNPGMGTATWRAPAGEEYRVNSLGLRGEEIGEKPAGKTRILLVGDSVLFGWKLRDDERLSVLLEQLLDSRIDGDRFEVFTVALPSWNTRSQGAFLRHHLASLAPDVVVWSLLQNDILDVPGVAPPGVLVHYVSPQDPSGFFREPLYKKHYRIPMPLLLERWQASLAEIAGFADTHGIPVLTLGWMLEPRHFEYVLANGGFDLPTMNIPREFGDDERWPVARGDRHPTAWANGVVALGIASRLGELGVLPALELDEDERRIVQRFERMVREKPTGDEIESYFDSLAASLPPTYTRAPRNREIDAIYGLNGFRMQRTGFCLLRDPGGATHAELTVHVPAAYLSAPRRLSVSVRDRTGGSHERDVAVDRTSLTVVLELPRGDTGYPVYELRWEFDYSECLGPRDCAAAELVRAALVTP